MHYSSLHGQERHEWPWKVSRQTAERLPRAGGITAKDFVLWCTWGMECLQGISEPRLSRLQVQRCCPPGVRYRGYIEVASRGAADNRNATMVHCRQVAQLASGNRRQGDANIADLARETRRLGLTGMARLPMTCGARLFFRRHPNDASTETAEPLMGSLESRNRNG